MRRIIQLCSAVGQVEVAFCEPMTGGEAYLYERKHHRHLDQHAHHRSQGGARRKAEEHRGRGDGDLEVVGSAYHSSRRRVFVRQFEDPGKAVAKPENQIRLDKKRYGYPQYRQGICDDDIALKAEEQHERRKERNYGDRRKHMEKFLPKPNLSLGLDDPLPREIACYEGKRHVDRYGKDERLPWHGKTPYAQEKPS